MYVQFKHVKKVYELKTHKKMAQISMKDIYMNTYKVKCHFVVVYLHSC